MIAIKAGCMTWVYLGGKRATSPKMAPWATPSHSPTNTTNSRMTSSGACRAVTASSCRVNALCEVIISLFTMPMNVNMQ